MVAGDHLPFPRAGGIDVSIWRYAKGIAEHRAQKVRRGWPPSMGRRHMLERVARTSRHISGRYQPPARGRLPQEVRRTAGNLSPPATLPLGRGLGRPSANSAGWAGWGGRVLTGHSDWPPTHGRESVCPHAKRSARFSMQPACTNSLQAQEIVAHICSISTFPPELSRASPR